MSSFLEKLNERLGSLDEDKNAAVPAMPIVKTGGDDANKPKESGEKFNAAVQSATQSYQFSVDIIQTADEILVFAPIAGADPAGFEISIDRENDVIIVKGMRNIPSTWNPELHKQIMDKGKYVQQECKWETFFRKIILPSEVEVFQSHAFFENGVLILYFPVLKLKQNQNLSVVEVVDGVAQPNIGNK
jgi:HSP20 family molecular chaperone IbpA